MKLIDRPNTTNQYYRLETHLDVVARRIPSFLSLWPFEAKFRGLAQIDFVHKDPATIIGGTGAGDGCAGRPKPNAGSCDWCDRLDQIHIQHVRR